MINKVLIKKDSMVTQRDYNKYDSPTDIYYYYVYYSNKPDQEGNYLIYSSLTHYGETRLIFKSKDKPEIIKLAENINNSLRLLAGYYDDNSNHKDNTFPLLPIKK